MLALEGQHARSAIVDALRAEAAAIRNGPQPAEGVDVVAAIERAAIARLARTPASSLRRVINATGVIVHTNLGRAPLARAAAERAARLAAGYTNLEYDVDRGARGRRDVHAERLICQLTGAEAAIVVNNNAAATLLVLAALARGREVIISRGELVEIGGGFRVPDVLAQSGAVLREVGTTNRTRIADYGAAIGERTGLLLRVHPSNFRMEGFTERPALAELSSLARRFNLPLAEDIGSGYLGSFGGQTEGGAQTLAVLRDEPVVSRSISAGVDVVMFSGDKLLGGPQAGIIAGRTPLIAQIRTHPLMRALRVDKLTYAALEATLEEFASERAQTTVPVAAMLWMSVEEIGERARALADALASHGIPTDVVDGQSTIGGGSAPGVTLPTRLLRIRHPALTASGLEAHLRRQDPPVIARIDNDHVVLDLRTVDPADDEVVARCVHNSREPD